MLRKELLDILCCPRCKGQLSYRPEKEVLTCVKCGSDYKVKNDIPIMLTDDERR